MADKIIQHPNGSTELPDGSGFCVVEIDTSPGRNSGPPVKWNPWNKVVQDHRDGTIHYAATDRERKARGLPVPWTPAMAKTECHEAPIP